MLFLDHPPIAGPDVLQRFVWGGVKVAVADLLTNDTDTDGDSLAIIGVSSNSAAGAAVELKGNWVYYRPPAGFTNTDTLTYSVSDGHCGGIAVGTVTVQIQTNNAPSANFTIQDLGDGSFKLKFAGIPGWTYRIQYAEDLTNPNWQDLATPTADEFGAYEYTDRPPVNTPSRFYRSVWP